MANSIATSLLVYDIPQRINNLNPSGQLRRIAIRINLSCWVIRQDRVPWITLEELKQAGADWHLIPFPDASNEAVVNLMLTNLRKDIKDAQDREKESLTAQDERLAAEEAEAGNEMTRNLINARKKHQKDREATLKRTEKLIKELEEAARLYNLDISTLSFGDSRKRVSGLRALNGARASLYYQMAEEAKGTRFEVAANEGSIPGAILADALEEEKGVNCQSAREAFMETTPSVESNGNVPPVVSSGNNGNGTNAHSTNGSAERATRRFSVNSGRRVVESSLTDEEAKHTCRTLGGNFERSLASYHSLSPNQRAWLHVRAIELERDQAANSHITAPSAPVVPSVATAPVKAIPAVEPAPAAKAKGEINNNSAVAMEISTLGMSYDKRNNRLSILNSNLGMQFFPAKLTVRSTRTNDTKVFSLTNATTADSVYIYRSDDGTLLNITDD